MSNNTKDVVDQDLMRLNEAFALAIGWRRKGKWWIDPLGARQLLPPPYFQHDALAWGGMARDKALRYVVTYDPDEQAYTVDIQKDGRGAFAPHGSLAIAICTAVATLHGRWEVDSEHNDTTRI